MPVDRVRGENTSSKGAGVASLPRGLSLNALKAGLLDRLRGGPPTRASGPSLMEMPPLTWGKWPSLTSALADLREHVGWGQVLGRALQEGGRWLGSVGDPETSGNFTGGSGRC